MSHDLEGKLAIVTGGSRGIGFHIACALDAQGATVVITGRSAVTLGEAARKIGPRCRAVTCDQRDPQSIKDLARQVMDEFDAPDILVNNAGVMRGSPVVEMSLDLWNEVIGTNLTGVFLMTRAFLGAMLKKGRADIFIISSMSGKKGDAGAAAYAASKFGVQGFAQALMYEVRKSNIRVMVLNPSSVDTSERPGHEYGPGVHLHAADLAATVVHLAKLPGRTMIRDMDIYGGNP